MASNDDNNNSPPSPTARRASTASQRLSEFFGRSPTATTGTPTFPGPITAAAHQANQKRRMSIATVGLGASPSQNSPFGPHARQDSFSSNGSGQGDSAIDDSGDAAPPLGSSPTFRRLSFGSRAMSQMSGGITNGRSQSISTSSPSTTPPSKPRAFATEKLEEGREEDQQASSPFSPSSISNVFNRRTGESSGFNWSNEMQNRAHRSGSITSPTSALAAARFPQKAASVSTSSGPPQPPPPPAPMKQQTPPDHFQERILKGDFYMD